MSDASRIGRWIPPLALMVLIYALSDQPNLNSGLGVIDTILRKLVHTAEFGLLCVLWRRALRGAGVSAGQALAIALAISIAYAVGDEYHQTFVEGRTGSALDVAIDSMGAVLGGLWAHRRELRSPARQRS